MFERLVQASDAMREANASLLPALSGCLACDTVQVIASATLGTCSDCGAELTVLGDVGAGTRTAEHDTRDAA